MIEIFSSANYVISAFKVHYKDPVSERGFWERQFKVVLGSSVARIPGNDIPRTGTLHSVYGICIQWS